MSDESIRNTHSPRSTFVLVGMCDGSIVFSEDERDEKRNDVEAEDAATSAISVKSFFSLPVKMITSFNSDTKVYTLSQCFPPFDSDMAAQA